MYLEDRTVSIFSRFFWNIADVLDQFYGDMLLTHSRFDFSYGTQLVKKGFEA